MNSSSSTTELVAAKRMDIYESFHQVNLWEDSFKVDHSTLNPISSPMLMMNSSSIENKVKKALKFLLFLFMIRFV